MRRFVVLRHRPRQPRCDRRLPAVRRRRRDQPAARCRTYRPSCRASPAREPAAAGGAALRERNRQHRAWAFGHAAGSARSPTRRRPRPRSRRSAARTTCTSAASSPSRSRPATRSCASASTGTFEFHPAHNHWHIGDVALFEVRKGSPTGPIVGGNSIKTTFCLIDWYKLEGNTNSAERVFHDCETELPGDPVGLGRPVPPRAGRPGARPDRGRRTRTTTTSSAPRTSRAASRRPTTRTTRRG